MLPREHPEFFRRPPPEGRSRESSIVLDAGGRFWHEGELVAHPGMQAAFATWIMRHPDDGRYVLCNGYDWSYFRVEETPFFVRSLRVSSEGASVRLSDGTEEPLAPETLSVGARDALYCRVKGGQFDARFTPGAQAGLVPYVVDCGGGQPGIELGSTIYPIGTRAGAEPLGG